MPTPPWKQDEPTLRSHTPASIICEAYDRFQPLMDVLMKKLSAEDGFSISPGANLTERAEQALSSFDLNGDAALGIPGSDDENEQRELAGGAFELVAEVGRLAPACRQPGAETGELDALIREQILGDEEGADESDEDLADVLRELLEGVLVFVEGWVDGYEGTGA
jgi:hypothetical protein